MLKLQYFGPDAKSRLIGKDPDAGKDWRQKEKRAAEDEMRWLESISDSMNMNLGNTPVILLDV